MNTWKVILLDCQVQKVSQEAAVFSNLDPATVYTFSIRTEKEGFKDSSPYIKEIKTGTACISIFDISLMLNFLKKFHFSKIFY